MKTMKIANSKITALYERLSRDDDLAGDSTMRVEVMNEHPFACRF